METWITPDAEIYSVSEETKGNAGDGTDFASEASDLKGALDLLG